MDMDVTGRISIVTGDITAFKADAVVNAANSSLLGGGGVDGAIHSAGGPSILQECREIRKHRYPEGLPAGQAVITGAGRLPCKWVIHTVGPVWRGGVSGEQAALESAYASCLSLARETGITSIAFPAISTGIYGFPKELAAVIAWKTITGHLEHNALPRTVTLVFYSERDSALFKSAIETDGFSV